MADLDLTPDQTEELDALRETNDALGAPSFLMRHHYRCPVVGPLIRHGYMTWDDPPEGFDKRRFAASTSLAITRASSFPSLASPLP